MVVRVRLMSAAGMLLILPGLLAAVVGGWVVLGMLLGAWQWVLGHIIPGGDPSDWVIMGALQRAFESGWPHFFKHLGLLAVGVAAVAMGSRLVGKADRIKDDLRIRETLEWLACEDRAVDAKELVERMKSALPFSYDWKGFHLDLYDKHLVSVHGYPNKVKLTATGRDYLERVKEAS